jgi:hypothetical protein
LDFNYTFGTGAKKIYTAEMRVDIPYLRDAAVPRRLFRWEEVSFSVR